MTYSTTPPPTGAIVPVWQTAREVYAVTWRLKERLPGAAAWPFLMMVGLTLLGGWVGNSLIGNVIVNLLSIAAYTLFAVAWHRVILLDSAAESGSPTAWARRHNRFFTFLLGYTVIATVVTLPLLLAAPAPLEDMPPEQAAAASAGLAGPSLLMLVAGVALWYLFMRMSFVFPASAVDERYGLAESWRHTRRNGLRLMALSLLLVLPPAVVFAMVIGIIALIGAALVGGPGAGEGPATGFGVIIGLVYALMYFVILALGIAGISIPFRRATGWVPAID